MIRKEKLEELKEIVGELKTIEVIKRDIEQNGFLPNRSHRSNLRGSSCLL